LGFAIAAVSSSEATAAPPVDATFEEVFFADVFATASSCGPPAG
jgi:hypothetical protein